MTTDGTPVASGTQFMLHSDGAIKSKQTSLAYLREEAPAMEQKKKHPLNIDRPFIGVFLLEVQTEPAPPPASWKLIYNLSL